MNFNHCHVNLLTALEYQQLRQSRYLGKECIFVEGTLKGTEATRQEALNENLIRIERPFLLRADKNGPSTKETKKNCLKNIIKIRLMITGACQTRLRSL